MRFIAWVVLLLLPGCLLAAEGEIVFLEPAGAPPALRGEVFLHEFSRPSLTTSGYRLKRQPIDLFDLEKLRKQVREVLAGKPVLLVSPASRAAMVVKETGSPVPTLFVSLPDPEAIGLVADKRKPEGTQTGYTYKLQDWPKLFEVAAEVVGPRAVLGLVVDRAWMTFPNLRGEFEKFRKESGTSIHVIAADDPAELEKALQAPRPPVAAWIVTDTAVSRSNSAAIVRLLRSTNALVVVESRQLFDEGADVMLAAVIENPLRTLAEMGDLVLSGVPISRIPVARPKRFELAVNVGAARRLPRLNWGGILRAADEVVY